MKMDVREGKQTGEEQIARVKVTLRSAKRSKFGVIACGCPLSTLFQSFQSSIFRNSTLGRSAPVAGNNEAHENRQSTKQLAGFLARLHWSNDPAPN